MDRNAFLQRVRHAVAEGNQAGAAPPLPVRGTVGHQGAGGDVVQRFGEALLAAGGHFHAVGNGAQAVEAVLELVVAREARRVLLGRGAVLEPLELDGRLRGLGIEVILADECTSDNWRDAFFAADVGVSGVTHLLAETGTMVMACKADDPRSVSLLPPVHIAVAERRQILPDLFDLFKLLDVEHMPSGLTLITGPSKTGDIELKLVTGVHGPGEIHVVLM